MVDIDSDLRLVNAVGGGSINRELKLEQVASDLSTKVVEYEPETSPILKIQFEGLASTVMLFTTGSYFIAGGSSINELYDTIDRLTKVLEKIGIVLSKDNISFEIRNLVFQWALENEFDLSALSVGLGLEDTEYNPESFPGAIYRPPTISATFIIFRTGTIMLMGVSNKDDVVRYYTELEKKLTKLGIELKY
jgi:transcription initiation factor TFIID TATA-box-binding protein